MPRVGPGSDNVTGDRYTLDLGVEPDLGNLLSNLTVANDLLDSVENHFKTIGDIVGSTTQRTAQLTRQTELLAAQAARVGASYAVMNNASMQMSGISAMQGYGGMYPGMMGMPGQMQFGGMGAPQQNVIQTMPGLGGAPGQIEDIPQIGRNAGQKQNFPLSVRAAAFEELAGRFGGGGTGPIARYGNSLRAGFQFSRHGAINPKTAEALARVGMGGGEALATGEVATTAATAAEGGGLLSSLASKIPAVGGLVGAFGEGGALAGTGALGGIGAAAGTVAPYALAAIAAYKLVASQVAESRRLTGITGGTGVIGGTGSGGFDTSAVGLRIRGIGMGFLNPGVDIGRTQEEALGAGYTGGAYTQARDYLFEAAKRGMSDTVDQVDLYEEAIDKAGGTTENLVGSIDRLQHIAVSTNSNLTAMTTNFKNSLEMFVGMGMGGNTAMSAALQQATMFSQNGVASMNPTLRNSGGYDITNTYNQAQVTAGLGIGYNMLGIQSALTPGLGTSIPALTEDVAVGTMANLGFKKGMTYQEVLKTMQTSGLGSYTGTVLQQMGALPQGVDPNNLRDVAMSVESVMGRPAAAALSDARAAGGALNYDVGLTTRTGGGRGAPTSTIQSGGSHIASLMGDGVKSRRTAEGYTALDTGGMQSAPLIQTYQDWIDQNHKTSPIVDAVLKGGEDSINNTYVMGPDGKTLTMQQFMETNTDWQKKLSDPKSGWQIATANQSQIDALNKAPTSDRGQMISNLAFGSGSDYIAGTTAAANEDQAYGDHADASTDLSENTIQRLKAAFKEAVDE